MTRKQRVHLARRQHCAHALVFEVPNPPPGPGVASRIPCAATGRARDKDVPPSDGSSRRPNSLQAQRAILQSRARERVKQGRKHVQIVRSISMAEATCLKLGHFFMYYFKNLTICFQSAKEQYCQVRAPKEHRQMSFNFGAFSCMPPCFGLSIVSSAFRTAKRAPGAAADPYYVYAYMHSLSTESCTRKKILEVN